MNSLMELHAVLAKAVAIEVNAICVFSMPASKVFHAISGAACTFSALKLLNEPLPRSIVPNELSGARRGSQRNAGNAFRSKPFLDRHDARNRQTDRTDR